VRSIAVAVLSAWLAVLIVFVDYWRATDLRLWFFYDDSFRDLGLEEWWAGLVRLAIIALAVVLSAAVFVLVPRRNTWVTPFGQATMYVYLLHSFVLYPLREFGLIGGEERSQWPWLVGLIALSVLVTLGLASPPVRRLLRPLVEPRPRWLFRPELTTRTGPQRLRPSRTDPTGSRRDRGGSD
jgi:fucose 4-O-acetylase-like acetyltransferase